jgi:hypothetical protein
MLPADTFGMRKRPLTLHLAKPRYNVKTIFKTYALFMYGDMRYINN